MHYDSASMPWFLLVFPGATVLRDDDMIIRPGEPDSPSMKVIYHADTTIEDVKKEMITNKASCAILFFNYGPTDYHYISLVQTEDHGPIVYDSYLLQPSEVLKYQAYLDKKFKTEIVVKAYALVFPPTATPAVMSPGLKPLMSRLDLLRLEEEDEESKSVEPKGDD